MNINSLQNKISLLRKQLVELASEKGSLSDENVILKSQELDSFIVKYQKMSNSARNRQNFQRKIWS